MTMDNRSPSPYILSLYVPLPQAVKSTLLEWDAKNILLGKWPATKCAAALMYTHKANPQLAPHIKPKDFSDATGVTLITMQRAARSVKKS